MSIPASHPLYGVSRRIIRATRYIEEAQKLIDAFGSECEDRILSAYDPSKKQFKIDFPEPSPDLPLAISDAVHNLRAALDYLVYELAFKDSGSAQHGTQFPIEECKIGIAPTSNNKIGFDIVAPRYLRGLSPKHVAAIEAMQPYNGQGWAQDLKDISNPDKHRKLIVVNKEEFISVWVRGPVGHGSKRLPNRVHCEHTAPHSSCDDGRG